MSSLTQNFHMATTFKTVVLNWWKKKTLLKILKIKTHELNKVKYDPFRGVRGAVIALHYQLH